MNSTIKIGALCAMMLVGQSMVATPLDTAKCYGVQAQEALSNAWTTGRDKVNSAWTTGRENVVAAYNTTSTKAVDGFNWANANNTNRAKTAAGITGLVVTACLLKKLYNAKKSAPVVTVKRRVPRNAYQPC